MRNWKIIAVLLIPLLLIPCGCSASAPVETPTPTPSLQLAASGTVRIRPGDAEGFSLDDTGVLAEDCHIKFTNNVPYSVDVHVVREMYPYESKPNAIRIEDYFKDVVTSTTGKSGELVVGMPFLRPPYTVWFVNNTANTDFEVDYEIYWEGLSAETSPAPAPTIPIPEINYFTEEECTDLAVKDVNLLYSHLDSLAQNSCGKDYLISFYKSYRNIEVGLIINEARWDIKPFWSELDTPIQRISDTEVRETEIHYVGIVLMEPFDKFHKGDAFVWQVYYKSGEVNAKNIDSRRLESELLKTTESTPPPIPQPLLPQMDSIIEEEAPLYFDWEDVEDPSGVTYTLQIATDINFTSLVLEKEGLTKSEYTLTEQKRKTLVPPEGEVAVYYWHVKTIDGASNESEWSGTGAFIMSYPLSEPTLQQIPDFNWTYPEIQHLGTSGDPDLFHETVPREVLENPEWETAALQKRVAELAIEYEKAHPYVEPNHVCRHMAIELWQVLKDNNITSLIVVGNTEDQEEWRINFGCDHVWLMVLGKNNLNLGVECTNGTVYSPDYMQPYEQDCEQAYQRYGKSSPQWESAKAAYDEAYSRYEQHLEGYFYRTPTALYGSTVLWFAPWNW